jgi:DNA polymerase-4
MDEIRKIIHIDMDCFYAAVEVKHRPELKGKPIGVGGAPDSRGVLTTASYEARRFGVRSAMPSSQALRLCPDLILVRPQMELYKKESRAVRAILERFTNVIQPLSLDEAFLDVTNSTAHGGSATLIAQDIRACIKTELQLTASAGVAPNKFLAKIASDWKKPDGLFVIRPEDVSAFMPGLKIEKIFGVGKVTARKMHDMGLHTCGDIQKRSPLELQRWFGSRAQELSERAHGIDHRPVESRAERKSLTVEETFATDAESLEACLKYLPQLYQDWERRMLRSEERDKIRGHVVKLKFFDFKTTTRERSSIAWPAASDFEELIATAWRRREVPVRLLGIGVRLEGDEAAEESDQLSFQLIQPSRPQ